MNNADEYILENFRRIFPDAASIDVQFTDDETIVVRVDAITYEMPISSDDYVFMFTNVDDATDVHEFSIPDNLFDIC